MSGSSKKIYHANNDEALAFGYMMAVAYFAASIMIILAWGYIFNEVNASVVNPMISEGEVSLQTANATAWNVNIIRYAPVPVLLFGFVWLANRGIFKRSQGG